MTADSLALLLAASSALALAADARRMSRRLDTVDAVGLVVVLPALLVFWRLVTRLAVNAVWDDWNGSRLAPAVALTRGYALYYLPTDGPILDSIYGPVSALAFLPVAVFTTPTAVILAGAVLNLGFLLVPSLLWVWRVADLVGAPHVRAVACWLGGCFLMTRSLGMHYWLSMVHADASALGLGLLACTQLLPAAVDGAPNLPSLGRRLDRAAVFAVLATWAKQPLAPLVPALVPMAWSLGGWPAARRFALTALVATAVSTMVFVSAFGFAPMWFNLVSLPSSHPWIEPGLLGLWHRGLELVSAAGPLLGLLGLTLVVFLAGGGSARAATRATTGALVAALALVTTGVLGANKYGGDQNSFHSLYFLLAAVLALMLQSGEAPVRELARAKARVGTYAMAAVALFLSWQGGLTDVRGPAPSIDPNPQGQAFAYAYAHPGTTYFPSQPLVNLLAEGRLEHFSYGVFDRLLGGYAPAAEHLRRFLPPDMSTIAVLGRDNIMGWFPEYRRRSSTPELPGWILFQRPGPVSPPD